MKVWTERWNPDEGRAFQGDAGAPAATQRPRTSAHAGSAALRTRQTFSCPLISADSADTTGLLPRLLGAAPPAWIRLSDHTDGGAGRSLKVSRRSCSLGRLLSLCLPSLQDGSLLRWCADSPPSAAEADLRRFLGARDRKDVLKAPGGNEEERKGNGH